MRIKQRLELNAWISLGVATIMLLSFALALREAAHADRNLQMTEAMMRTRMEGISIRDDFLLYREQRARKQWMAKSASMEELLAAAAESLPGERNRALVAEAGKNLDSTRGLFEELSPGTRTASVQGGGFARDEAESRLISQLLLKSYALSDDIGRLNDAARDVAISARSREVMVMVLILLAGAFALIVNSTLLNRVVARRIVSLREGIELMGSGRLEHRIEASGDDELSDLARAGNEMASRLKESYTSVENLRREVAGRIQAERERGEAEEKIRILNDDLERRVAERTAELIAKTAELERLNRVFVDRELRMRELKERLAVLEGKGG